MNLLDDALISVRRGDGSTRMLSLPKLFADLVRDEVVDYPAMRAHQRPAWHTLLVQLGALAAHRQAESLLPDDAAIWRQWLLALTPQWPGGEAWALCADVLEQPAFLQPAVTGGQLDGFKPTEFADDIDVLISSKNHDVKQSSIGRPAPEHWLYALVTLQTQQGFFGAGNYGISRMNGGFSSRPLFGVRPRGGHGRVARDVRELLLRRAQTLADFPFYQAVGGHALIWLCPWDGTTSLSVGELDPWYIEICRRIRLTADSEHTICAWVTGTSVARIDAKGMSGLTGDPWTPIVADGAGWKALTAHSETMHYRNLVPLLFPRVEDSGAASRAPLQVVTERDEADGLRISVAVVVRGQGKTEGLYEREIPVSRMTRRFFSPFGATDVGAHVAQERVADVALISRQVLYPAALAVFTGAPLAGERKRDDDTAKSRASSAVGEFERAVDLDFFEQLNLELEHIDDESRSLSIRSTWLTDLTARARKVLEDTMQRAPSSAARRYRTQARASLLFSSSLRRHLGDRVIAAPAVAAAKPEPDSVEENNAW
jgi:CRISPR system Cascade subunit CasA